MINTICCMQQLTMDQTTEFSNALILFATRWRLLSSKLDQVTCTQATYFTHRKYFTYINRVDLVCIEPKYREPCVERPRSRRHMVFKTNYRLMQVKGSILQYFRPSLSYMYHLSLRPLFCLVWHRFVFTVDCIELKYSWTDVMHINSSNREKTSRGLGPGNTQISVTIENLHEAYLSMRMATALIRLCGCAFAVRMQQGHAFSRHGPIWANFTY